MKKKKVEDIVKKTIEEMNSQSTSKASVMSDKEFCDAVHMLIHAARLSSNLKPSEIDFKLSKLVIDKFSPTCKECKDVRERTKNTPQKQGFFSKLLDVAEGE